MKFESLDLKREKGVAGLTVLLSLIVMLFVIGLLVMIFSLMGGGMRDATYDSTTVAIQNETVTTLNESVGDSLTASTLRNVVCSVTLVTNVTGAETVPSTNYSMVGCLINGTSDSAYLGFDVNVTYSYTFDADNTATDVLNDTTAGISSTTDWFDIFIVIGAMVVLILLTVIIIVAIRGSGLMTGGGSTTGAGSQNVGSA